MSPTPWDYLIVSASNESQAEAYERQLAMRRSVGLLNGIRTVLVTPDPEGRRVGSGGVLCAACWRCCDGSSARMRKERIGRRGWRCCDGFGF